MPLKDIRPTVYSITVDGKELKLKLNLNSLDYLERTVGGLEGALKATDVQSKLHLIRAFMLVNYTENLDALEENRLEDLQPKLSQIGQWFDTETLNAVTVELYRIAIESMGGEGEKRPGEYPPELIEALIGSLSRLFGVQNWDKAVKAFGKQPQKRSSRGSGKS